MRPLGFCGDDVHQPTFLMDNFTAFSQPVMEEGILVVRLPLPGGIPRQMVSVRDIGQVAAAALIDPDSVPGGAVVMLGDDDQEKMFTWFTRLPTYRADRTLIRQLVPDAQAERTGSLAGAR
jgi:uncharacterized protein YbjT (DUF2867 family)